nr:hypothetical protein [Tanacetum cinerariifolium]
MAPRAVLMNTGLRPLNNDRPVNTAHPKATVYSARLMSHFSKSAQSTGNPHLKLQEKGVIDSGCSWQTTRNMSYLFEYKETDGGYVAFGGDLNGGKITCKGKIITDTECVVLSPNFKLLDESQVLLRVPRKNMYSVDLKNVAPLGGKFDGKDDEGFFVGYFMNSKAFRVFNSRTRIVEETLHINFLENKPNVAGSGTTWLFDTDRLTKSMNYKPVVAGNQSNGSAGKDSPGDGFKPSREEEKKDSEDLMNEDNEVLSTKETRVNQEKDANINNINNINTVSPTANATSIKDNTVVEDIVYRCADDPNMPNLEEIVYSDDDAGVGAEADITNLDTNIPVSPIPTTRIYKDHSVKQIFRDLHLAPQTRRMTQNVTNYEPKKQVSTLVDLPYGKRAIGTKWIYKKKKDERGIGVRNKPRLVAQGYTQEEGIDYDDVFALVARIKAIRLFLAYTSFKDFVVYQMDMKSAFMYDKIEEETACTPMKNSKPLLKDETDEDVDVHLYKSMIGKLTTAVDVNVVEVNPTIYTSCIKQLWATANVNTVNKEEQIQALVDKKKVIITETSVRNDLQLEDDEVALWPLLSSVMPQTKNLTSPVFLYKQVEGMFKHKDIYVKPSHTKKTSVPTKVVVNEAVYEEMYDSVERAITTATDLDAEQDRGIISKTQFMTKLNEPSSIETSSGSGPRRQETIGDAAAQTRVLSLETTKTNQALEIGSLKRRVKKLKKKSSKRTHNLNRLYKIGRNDQEMFDTCVLDDEEVVAKKVVSTDDLVTTAGKVVTTAGVEVSATATTPTISIDDITLAKALAALKSEKSMVKEPSVPVSAASTSLKVSVVSTTSTTVTTTTPRAKGIVMQEHEETIIRTTTTIPSQSSKDMGKKLDEKVEAKVDNDQEEAEMKMYMKIVSDDEVAIDAIPLATKPPIIVDWKIIKEGKISSYHIVRHDESLKRNTRPEEAYERVLWGNLKVMFKPDIEKKRYPLTPATISEMLNRKLQADHWNEMCYQLLKLMLKQQKKK